MQHNLHNADFRVKQIFSDLQRCFLQNAGMAKLEAHERLKIARLRRYKTARAAVEALGVPYGTYTGHEAGTRGFAEDVERYARAFRVRPAWLAFEDGPMEPAAALPAADIDTETEVGVFGYIGAGGSIDTATAQIEGHEPLFQVRVPFPIPDDALAFQIQGESMWPKYDPGDVIVCSRFADNPDAVLGHTAAVETAEGSRYLKRVLKGSKPGHFLLLSHNAPEMVDVAVVSFSAVIAVIPASQVHEATNQARRAVIKQIKTGKALRG